METRCFSSDGADDFGAAADCCWGGVAAAVVTGCCLGATCFVVDVEVDGDGWSTTPAGSSFTLLLGFTRL